MDGLLPPALNSFSYCVFLIYFLFTSQHIQAISHAVMKLALTSQRPPSYHLPLMPTPPSIDHYLHHYYVTTQFQTHNMECSWSWHTIQEIWHLLLHETQRSGCRPTDLQQLGCKRDGGVNYSPLPTRHIPGAPWSERGSGFCSPQKIHGSTPRVDMLS